MYSRKGVGQPKLGLKHNNDVRTQEKELEGKNSAANKPTVEPSPVRYKGTIFCSLYWIILKGSKCDRFIVNTCSEL